MLFEAAILKVSVFLPAAIQLPKHFLTAIPRNTGNCVMQQLPLSASQKQR